MQVNLTVNQKLEQKLEELVNSIANEGDMVRILGNYSKGIEIASQIIPERLLSNATELGRKGALYEQQIDALATYTELALFKQKLETRIASYRNPPYYFKKDYTTPILKRIDQLTTEIRKYVPEPFKTNEK